MLHDTGIIVWHNVPKLRDMVVINPQWLADAMAGVVTFMCQGAASQAGGMIDWAKIRNSLKLKYVYCKAECQFLILKFFFFVDLQILICTGQ